MPRHVPVRPGSHTRQQVPPPRFSSQQLTTAALVVVALFIGLSYFLSNYTPGHLSPDRSYPLPAHWPYLGLVPPRGSTPAESLDFLALDISSRGYSFESGDGADRKQGISFSNSAGGEKLLRYFNEMLTEAKYTLSGAEASGKDANKVLAVWNSEYGNVSVILRCYGERYELAIHGE